MLKTKKNNLFNPKGAAAIVLIPGNLIKGYAKKDLLTAGATFFTFTLNTVGFCFDNFEEQVD